jgi:cell division protein FtsZ
VIPNDRLLAVVDSATTVKNAFAMCDEVLRQAVEGVSDLITTPGNINLDFADIKAIMEDAGSALMGVGLATGDKRAEDAARLAINSPLLDISINGAKGVLLSIAGGEDLGLLEVQAAAQIVTESIDKNAKVIFGTSKDERLKKGEVRVTVIATGFPEEASGRASGASLFQLGAKKDKKDEAEVAAAKPAFASTPTRVVMEEEETIIVERQTPAPKPPSADDDDDWGAVPAFLRRNRKS